VDVIAQVDLAPLPARHTGRLARPRCDIYYEVTGAGPAILFAHGLGGNHLSWWQQVAHFASKFTCVTFAHRGFAPSSRLSGGPDPSDYADDLAAVVAYLNLADVRVVAQSMGGWSAVEYALRRPPELRALVLAATTGSVDPQSLPESDRMALAAWAVTSERELAALAAAAIHPAAGRRMARERPDLHLLYRHIDDMNAGLDKQALRRKLMAGRVRKPSDLASVACPVLMISNDEDVVIPPMAADGIARVVPQISVAHIRAAGHSGYFERPVEFNGLLERFFAGVC
jgi:3-oxoadipate enol-lactonase